MANLVGLITILSCTYGATALWHGEDALPGEFPYAVQVFMHADKINGSCSGAIVGRKHVVTAAHCVSEKSFNDSLPEVLVIAGTNTFGDNESLYAQVQKVKQIWVHENFTTIRNNDIALLELQHPLAFNELVKPVRLPGQNQTFEGSVVTCGWGDTEYGFPDTLQKVAAQLVQSSADCDEQIRSNVLDLISSNPTLRPEFVSLATQIMQQGQQHGQVSVEMLKAFAISFAQKAMGVTLSEADAEYRAQVLINRINHLNRTAIAGDAEERATAFTPISDAVVCAKGVNASGMCKGDSGGPLVSHVNGEPFLVGVASAGMMDICGKFDSPSYFTRVASYTNWIKGRIVASLVNSNVVTIHSNFANWYSVL